MKTPVLVSFLTTVPSGRSVGSGAGVGRGRLAGRRIRSRVGRGASVFAVACQAVRFCTGPGASGPPIFAIGGQNADSDDRNCSLARAVPSGDRSPSDDAAHDRSIAISRIITGTSQSGRESW